MKRLILFALISTIVFGISAITFKEALMDSKSVLCAAENAIQWELRALTDDKLGYYDLDSSKLVGQSMELDKVTEDNICGFCAETASSYIGNYDVGRIIGVTTGEGSTSWSKR